MNNSIEEFNTPCGRCGHGTFKPVWFLEHEYDGGVQTGRVREAASHLECDAGCGKCSIVDGTFDKPWRYK